MSELLTTETVSPADRLAYWREMICDVYADLDAEPLDRGGFSGSVSLSEWGGARLSVVSSDAQVVRRQPGRPKPDCLVSVQLAGTGRITQSDRTAALRPGDCALYDATRPYALEFDGAFSQLVLQFSRDSLIARNVHIESTVARTCSGDSGLAAIAAGFLRNLTEHDGEVDNPMRDRLGEQAIDIMAAALGEVTGLGASPAATRTADRARVLRFVDANLADPNLSVNAVAASFGVSARTIQKLFETDDVHLADRIRRARVERAKTMLRDPLRGHYTVARIAHEVGFNSPNVFSRAFRSIEGCTPREYREG